MAGSDTGISGDRAQRSRLTALDAPVVCPITVGRESHLAAVDRLLASLARGSGTTLLVTGEAGIGKSRLVAETTARAAALGMTCLQATCFETDRALPYAPFLELLRSMPSVRTMAAGAELAAVLPELAPGDATSANAGLEAQHRKRWLFQTITTLMSGVADERPLVLVVEDVHWADETSLELLLSLARTAARSPMLLVLTYRSDEPGQDLVAVLTALDRERLEVELRLQRLSVAELEIMLRAIFDRRSPERTGLIEVLHELTDGNPFFVEEVLRSLIGAGDIYFRDGRWDGKAVSDLHVPRSVDDAVQRRMVQLTPAAREVAALAAVAGRGFDFDLLGALSGRDEVGLIELIKELIAAGLLVEESGDRLAFRHALTRQAIHSHLLARERRALHRKVAEALEGYHATSTTDVAADLAYHYFEARSWERALAHAREAGLKALRMYAPRAAIDHLTRASQAADALGLAADPEIYRLRAQAHDLAGNFASANADLDSALAAARAQSDRPAEWRALLDLSLLWAGRNYDQTGAYAMTALDVARAIGDPHLIAQTLNRIGNWHTNLEHTGQALVHLQEALSLFEELGDERGRAETLDLLGMATIGSATRSAAYYAEAIPLLRRLDDRPRLVTSLVMTMLANGGYLYLATPAGVTATQKAVAAGEEALRIVREIGWPAGESFVLWETALWLAPRGEYRRALECAEAGLAIATDIDHRQWMAGGGATLGGLYLELLDPASAQATLDRALVHAREVGSNQFVRIIVSLLAGVRLLRRQPTEAERILDDVLAADAPMDSMAQRLCWLARAEIRLQAGDPAGALEITERLIQTTEPRVAPRLWRVRGDALAELGRRAESLNVLNSARTVAAEQRARAETWRIDASLARLLRVMGRREEAERAIRAARATLGDLAAEVDDSRLRETFMRGGAAMVPAAAALSPRRAAQARFGGLTTREREVARLVASGLSNRAIADRLILGERTVESYVGNVLGKLAFTSRAQIAAWAVESGLIETDG